MSDLNQMTKDYFTELFGFEDDPRINDLGNYTLESDGITHIFVSDTSSTWKLINGRWVEQEVF